MTGLDKIIEQINSEAAEAVNSIIEKAEEKAKEISKEAEAKAQAEADMLLEKAEDEINILKERALSANELAKKQAILGKKIEIVNSLISEAKDKLMSLDAEEYFELLKNPLKKIRDGGRIFFNENDLKRITESFEKALSGKSISLSNEPVDIDGGFIVKYGDTEENCSLEALFKSSEELLLDKVNQLIFG